ncbi:MAG: alanyl-tRNA editing protein [Chloroflexota bacterium]
MRTERLYHGDAYARQFTARVLERPSYHGKPALILDRTLFYPTAGGQPHDVGTIDGVPVLDVVETNDAIVHVLAAPVTGETVAGSVDWTRRFDHMQQHTGQHILSQAFVQRLEAETVSFHLGDDISSIDVATSGLSPQQLNEVEDLANAVIYADTPIHADFVTPERLAALPLRKPPKVKENVRIVEVEGFDWSPCGGTHTRSAGEIGIIKLRRSEKRGNDTRVEFLCGRRALRDYRWRVEHLLTLGGALSVRDDEAVAAMLRALEAAKTRDREAQLLRDKLLDYEAAALGTAAPRVNGVALVSEVFVEREFDELKRLALKLTAGESAVALLGSQGQKGQLVFARSADVACDMNAILKAACTAVGGRGGGTPALAQGGAPDPTRIPEAVAQARRQVEEGLEG